VVADLIDYATGHSQTLRHNVLITAANIKSYEEALEAWETVDVSLLSEDDKQTIEDLQAELKTLRKTANGLPQEVQDRIAENLRVKEEGVRTKELLPPDPLATHPTAKVTRPRANIDMAVKDVDRAHAKLLPGHDPEFDKVLERFRGIVEP
jgi:hypothetical protein